MPQISNPKNDRRSLTHTFSEVESSNGTRQQNSANSNTKVLEWTCPRKFESIRYAGGRHKTKFIPRYMESASPNGTQDVTLSGNIQPIAGETTPDDMPYPPVVAYNTSDSKEYTDLSYDFASNTVTLPEDPQGDTVKLYPTITEGTLQYRGLDQFNHEIAPLDEWSTPIHVFHDFEQDNNQTELHLVGAVQWRESETLALYLDSPRQIVWEDADYPRGQYVSTIEQRVDVSV
jgi:hypothetical protein